MLLCQNNQVVHTSRLHLWIKELNIRRSWLLIDHRICCVPVILSNIRIFAIGCTCIMQGADKNIGGL